MNGKIEFGSRQIAIIALSTAVYSVLNWLSAAFQVVPGASLIYPATAAAIVFSLWFGVWGMLGAYFGTIIGGFAWGSAVHVNMTGGLHDMMEGLIPAIAFFSLRLDRGLRDRKSFLLYILFACILGTAVNAILGNLNYALWGVLPLNAVPIGFWSWWLADLVAAVVLGIPILRFLTPFVERTSLYHEGFLARRLKHDEDLGFEG
jgi:hypothetical protein